MQGQLRSRSLPADKMVAAAGAIDGARERPLRTGKVGAGGLEIQAQRSLLHAGRLYGMYPRVQREGCCGRTRCSPEGFR